MNWFSPKKKTSDIPMEEIPEWAALAEANMSAIDTLFDQWEITHSAQIKENSMAQQLRSIKSLVFMRLNAARDKKDRKAIELYREIQEAMR